jgi:DnaJ domain
MLIKALKYFSQSYEINYDRKTETYIHQCRRLINKKKLQEEAAKTPDVTETPADNGNNQNNQNQDQDKECSNIIDKKDYYEILGLTKDADENEIKKAYKKVRLSYYL